MDGLTEMAAVEKALGRYARMMERESIIVFTPAYIVLTPKGGKPVAVKITEQRTGYLEAWAYGHRITPRV